MLSQELAFVMSRLDESLRGLADVRDRMGDGLNDALLELRHQIDTIDYMLDSGHLAGDGDTFDSRQRREA